MWEEVRAEGAGGGLDDRQLHKPPHYAYIKQQIARGRRKKHLQSSAHKETLSLRLNQNTKSTHLTLDSLASGNQK